MAINKVIFGGNTLIDLTSDTVTASDVLSGVSFHLPSGESGTGTCTYDSDTSEDTAVVAEVLAGSTFHARGVALTGTMTNNGAVTGTISTKSGIYTIPQGFHDGSGVVQLAEAERNKIIPANIKSGVVLLGVTGEYTGESVSAQQKTVAPTTVGFTVTPDASYDYLSEVVVSPISYVLTNNAAGGQTATIAG